MGKCRSLLYLFQHTSPTRAKRGNSKPRRVFLFSSCASARFRVTDFLKSTQNVSGEFPTLYISIFAVASEKIRHRKGRFRQAQKQSASSEREGKVEGRRPFEREKKNLPLLAFLLFPLPLLSLLFPYPSSKSFFLPPFLFSYLPQEKSLFLARSISTVL